MVNIDDNLKYRCIICIFNVILKNNCPNNCDSYKCLACNTNYYMDINGNIIFGHNTSCYKIKNIPI